MSQDFIILNTDTREYLEPNCFGEGSQWGQVARGEFGSMFALAYLLSTDRDPKSTWMGAWKGQRITLVGDYSTEAEIMWDPECSHEVDYKDVFFDVILELARTRPDFALEYQSRVRKGSWIWMEKLPNALRQCILYRGTYG